MSNLNALIRGAIQQQLLGASRAQLLQLAETLLDGPAAAELPRQLSAAEGRHLRMTADKVTGSLDVIPDDAWCFTYDQDTGLVWTHLLGNVDDGQSHAKSMQLCEDLQHFGAKWQAGEIMQVLTTVDFGLCDPAQNQKAFRGPYGWQWTRTKCVSPAEYAWAVNVDGGYSYGLPQSFRSRVRGVCPSQSLGLR